MVSLLLMLGVILIGIWLGLHMIRGWIWSSASPDYEARNHRGNDSSKPKLRSAEIMSPL